MFALVAMSLICLYLGNADKISRNCSCRPEWTAGQFRIRFESRQWRKKR